MTMTGLQTGRNKICRKFFVITISNQREIGSGEVTEKMSVHDGHRARMKARFRENGINGFAEHEVIELLLYYAIPQGDVNPLAHRILEHFGSLAGVFDATVEELMTVSGVGLNTALLIKLVPQVGRRYMVSRSEMENIITSPRAAGEYMKSRFYGEREEVVYTACLDAKGKVIGCRMIGQGSVNSANVSIRKIVEYALSMNATAVILAHNHTSGIALPSKEDELSTRRVWEALRAVDIELIDHIVVADEDFVSMADNGFFTKK